MTEETPKETLREKLAREEIARREEFGEFIIRVRDIAMQTTKREDNLEKIREDLIKEIPQELMVGGVKEISAEDLLIIFILRRLQIEPSEKINENLIATLDNREKPQADVLSETERGLYLAIGIANFMMGKEKKERNNPGLYNSLIKRIKKKKPKIGKSDLEEWWAKLGRFYDIEVFTSPTTTKET